MTAAVALAGGFCCRILARLLPAGVAVTAGADNAAFAAASPEVIALSRSSDRTKALSLAKYSLCGVAGGIHES